MLSETPRGKYIIEICKSTPCHVLKGLNIVNIFEQELNIKIGETTPDNLFTLQYTSCVGACDIGPVAKIGDEVYGNLTKDKIVDIIKSYREAAICQK
jgi:NADH-quinone oxidoreductase subunit E